MAEYSILPTSTALVGQPQCSLDRVRTSTRTAHSAHNSNTLNALLLSASPYNSVTIGSGRGEHYRTTLNTIVYWNELLF